MSGGGVGAGGHVRGAGGGGLGSAVGVLQSVQGRGTGNQHLCAITGTATDYKAELTWEKEIVHAQQLRSCRDTWRCTPNSPGEL